MISIFNRKKQKKEQATLYRDCSDLPIFNFDAIATKGNLSWLVVGFDGYKEVVFDEQKAGKIWTAVYEEWKSLNDDNSTFLFYELLHEISKLKIRKYVAAILLSQIERIPRPKAQLKPFIDELAEWGFKIDIDGDMDYQMGKMERQLRATDNRIEMKEAELKALSEDNEESMSLVQQCVKLEQGLSRNDIDTKKTPVLKWIALLEEMKAINIHRNKKRVA